ncbi:NACHT domain-containing protein [Streptomyces sp. NPDC047082]|uniref:NACHT domain-containing protein n=1 Tax=Streptomyces sp. NPDC047082 TaxID=3155259 RepID=UPI0033D69636
MGAAVRARRVGVLYLVLSVGGMAGAVWVTLRFGLPVAQTVVALLPSVGGLYLSWAAFRADRREGGEDRRLGVAEIADRLAVAVRGQWDAEACVRRLNDPYPLAVAWQPADERFAESWPLLREMAENWPSGGASDPDGWAVGPAELTGAGGEIAEVFLRRVPTRRLVLLGGPGSGKTMLLIRLLLSLVAEREAGGAVPVLFPLASWNPGEASLEEWMVARLARDYTGLGDPQAGHAGQVGHARALLEHRLILPILDGFDEIPEGFRGAALDSINAALPLGQPVVLSSRVTEYEETLGPACGVPVKLSGAAAVELRPLDPADIAEYLSRDAGGGETVAAARWEPVVRLLGTDAPVARTLTTPLMLFLARTVYNPRPGEQAAALPAPADLCDPARFPDPVAIREHLFDAFVPAAYRPHPRYPCRWSACQAEDALRYLARHLRQTAGGTTDLAWWQLHRALPPRTVQVVTAVVLGGVAWVATAGVGRLTALLAGLDSGWLTGPPAAVVGGLAGGIAGGIGCGIVAGLTGGLAEGMTNALASGQPGVLTITIANGLAYGFAGGIVGALSSRLTDGPRGARDTGTAWAWDWRMCILGFAAGAALWFAFRPGYGPAAAAIGALGNGVVYGLAGGAIGARARSLAARRPGAAPTVRTVWAWDWRGFTVGLASGSAIGITHCAVLRLQSLLTSVPSYTFATMLSFACAFGLAVGLVHGLKGRPADLATAVGPSALLEQDRTTFCRLWVAIGLAVGGVFLLCYGIGYAVHEGIPYGLTRGTTGSGTIRMGPPHILDRGLAYGITIGLAAALSHNAWWYYTLARHYLAMRRRLPRDLTAFLTDAHERRGVLRQAGAVHQFRHIDLHHHLGGPVLDQDPEASRASLPGPRFPVSLMRRH